MIIKLILTHIILLLVLEQQLSSKNGYMFQQIMLTVMF